MNVWSFCSTGKACSRFAARPFSAGSAAAAVTPGLSRPSTKADCPPRSVSDATILGFESFVDLVVHSERQPDLRAKDGIVPVNPFGMMPTTVKGRPLMMISEPRTARLRPCFFQ